MQWKATNEPSHNPQSYVGWKWSQNIFLEYGQISTSPEEIQLLPKKKKKNDRDGPVMNFILEMLVFVTCFDNVSNLRDTIAFAK